MGFGSDIDVILLLRKVTHNPRPLTGTGCHLQTTAQLFDTCFDIRESVTMPLERRSIEPYPMIFHDQTNPSFVQFERDGTCMRARVTQTIAHGLPGNGQKLLHLCGSKSVYGVGIHL